MSVLYLINISKGFSHSVGYNFTLLSISLCAKTFKYRQFLLPILVILSGVEFSESPFLCQDVGVLSSSSLEISDFTLRSLILSKLILVQRKK